MGGTPPWVRGFVPSPALGVLEALIGRSGSSSGPLSEAMGRLGMKGKSLRRQHATATHAALCSLRNRLLRA